MTNEWVAPYENYVRGDVVRVEGMRGDFTWINAHILNGVLESYTVFSSRTGMRSFRPERVTPKRKKKS